MPRTHSYARSAVALLGAGLMCLPAAGAFAQGKGGGSPRDTATVSAATQPFQLVDDRPVDDRLPQPEDRYALSGGCYTIEAPGAGYVARGSDGLVVAPDATAAEPFHFQATRLGQYLIATNEGPDTSYEGAWWDVRGYLAAAGVLPALPTGELGLPLPGDGLMDEAPWPSMPTSDSVTVASEPGEAADWAVVAAGEDPDARAPKDGGQAYVLSLPSEDKALAVVDGALTLVAGDAGDGFAFHHVADDDPNDDDANGTACADWPEISTNTSGLPSDPGGNPAGEVEGFFEAHIHGMAFEFLGGELRCGRPWHPYGVEYALPDCREDGQVSNPVTEIALASYDPSSYDPVGWPTFNSWPNENLLTHEQFYWKWLQRSYEGGLRLMTNLLVENTALCQLFPQKKNSCNEMDSVRLQARRLYELQDYIDAQYGGPGEGWFRIVTTPAQARAVINSGRLAVVMGVEVSQLFDCGEILDVAQCTAEQIDQRVQEVHDMGVRQVEMINKFDNALSGVAGDGGTTGVIVNQGNKYVTGHYWDMRTCPPEADAGHDHGIMGHPVRQDPDEPRRRHPDRRERRRRPGRHHPQPARWCRLHRGARLPARAALQHPRGLTELGAHAVRELIDNGIMFDPDHMSAAGQREALNLVEDADHPRAARLGEEEPQGPDRAGPGLQPQLGQRRHLPAGAAPRWPRRPDAVRRRQLRRPLGPAPRVGRAAAARRHRVRHGLRGRHQRLRLAARTPHRGGPSAELRRRLPRPDRRRHPLPSRSAACTPSTSTPTVSPTTASTPTGTARSRWPPTRSTPSSAAGRSSPTTC